MPVWPMLMRKVVFYVSLSVVLLYLAVLALRTLVFLLLRGFGLRVWLFPDMMNDKFWPLLSAERQTALSACEVLVRVLLVGFFGFVGFRLYQEPATIGEA